MLPSGKEFITKFKFVHDKAGADQAADSVDKIRKRVKGAGDEIDAVKKKQEKFNETIGKLQQIGVAVTAAGTAITAGMLASARGYVQQVGTAEQTSRRWLGSMRALEVANMRIGRVIAHETVPYMEKMADLAERTASFVEKNPGAVKAALVVAGSMVGVGTLLTSAVSVIKTIQTIQSLGTLLNIGSAAGAAGATAAAAGGTAGAVTGAAARAAGRSTLTGAAAAGAGAATIGGGMLISGIVSSVLGGVLAGFVANNALANTQFGQRIGFQPMSRWATVGAYGAGKLLGGEQQGLQWAAKIGEMTGAIDSSTASMIQASAAADNLGQEVGDVGREIDFTSQQIAAYISYTRQEQIAVRQRNLQLERMERDYNRQVLIDNQDFALQRTRSLRDFARQELLAEKDYYRQRMLRARDYGIEVARQEYDHQKSIRRAAEDHQWNLRRIILEGDAMAFWEENYQYNKQRQREEEDYQLSVQRRNEDFAREMADSENEFNIQRERRMEEFRIRLRDEDQDFRIRRQRAQYQYNLMLYDNEVNWNEERRVRRQALVDQLRDLYGGLETERYMRREFTRAMLADLQAAINSIGRTNTSTGGSIYYFGRASGGYVDSGLYRMHDHEFVLNRRTTEAAEQLAGGSLNQGTILALMSGYGSGGGRQIVYNDHRTFERGLTADERQYIRQETERILSDVLSDFGR